MGPAHVQNLLKESMKFVPLFTERNCDNCSLQLGLSTAQEIMASLAGRVFLSDEGVQSDQMQQQKQLVTHSSAQELF